MPSFSKTSSRVVVPSRRNDSKSDRMTCAAGIGWTLGVAQPAKSPKAIKRKHLTAALMVPPDSGY
ncbi:MAG: hypothetical protein ACE5HI_14305 [bacterium]